MMTQNSQKSGILNIIRMLVDSMTSKEVRNEVMSDVEALIVKASHLRHTATRVALKQTKFPYVYIVDWTSPRKNKWLIVFNLYRRNTHKGGAGITGVCLQKYPKGYAAHRWCIDKNKTFFVSTYLPHFFDRYAERMNLDKTGIDLIKHFIRKNTSGQHDYTSELSGIQSRDGNVVHICHPEGIAMGEEPHALHQIFKTFITYEMAKGKQLDVFIQKKDSISDGLALNKEVWYESNW